MYGTKKLQINWTKLKTDVKGKKPNNITQKMPDIWIAKQNLWGPVER